MNEDLKTRAEQLIRSLRERHITFCAGAEKLEHLAKILFYCREVLKGGLYMEAGVAMGGSAMLIALLKPEQAKLKLYDVYDLLPPPGEEDGAKAQLVYEQFKKGEVSDPTSKTYLAKAGDMLGFVKQNFVEAGIDPAAHKVEFIKGLFQESMHIHEPVAFCHIDCDWVESVRTCVERVKEHMLPGGVILFDDYHSFEGCGKFVDAWVASDSRFRITSKAWNVAVQRVQ